MKHAPAKLLPLVAEGGPLAGAFAEAWTELAPGLAERLGLDSGATGRIREDALRALRAWTAAEAAGETSRAPLHAWLVRLRQDLSLEGLVQVLVQLERALRRASWRLGLPGPDWQAIGEMVGTFFEMLFEEAAAGWQGLQAQNTQLREELTYFHRLAAALETGRDLDDHLRLAVRETARLLQCEFCAILLPREDDRDVLAIRAVVAPKILTRALEGMGFPLAENGLIAQVFMTGAPASTYSPLEDLEVTLRRRQTLESLGFSQLLAFPLQVHGRVLGVLCLANRLDDQPWQALEEEWLATVAGQLAASIRLSQLFGRAEAGEQELATLLEALIAWRDPRLAAHGAAVGELARELGAMLGLEGARLESLAVAGRLHDLGQIFWPDALRLRPGPLWPEDGPVVAAHPVAGEALLTRVKALEALAPAIRHHHERWDGAGYPDGLRGAAIPLEARVLAVADAFVTLTTPQTYREPVPASEALGLVRAAAGTQFDALAVQALVQVCGDGGAEPPVIGRAALQPSGRVAPGASAGAPAPDLPTLAPRLLGLINALAATADDDDFFEAFWRALEPQVDFDAAALFRLASGVNLELAETRGWKSPPERLRVPEDGLEAYAAACRVPVAVADILADPRFKPVPPAEAEGFRSAAAFPLMAGDRPLGVLTLYRRGHVPFTGAEQAASELAAALLGQGLARQAWRLRQAEALDVDALTGLASARRFGERVAQELARAERFELPVAACLIDFDGFDAFVEANGMALGDEALLQAAELLRALARPADVLARVGGDAFGWLMPELAAAEAMAAAEAARRAIAEARFPGRRAGGARLTAGVGLTAHRGAGLGRKALMNDLRTALAKAKGEGPGRLVFYARAEAES